ncbi:GNAT family N-acetyltransferase [Undibacterium squillarum]|uniref:GNAT family N-acetyltransferase n=1 Tax=Undibacterium squillarum TaxID=1131567 RepID=UPI0035B220E3
MPDLTIREAGQADAALIADLTRQCWANKVASSSSGHRENAEQVETELAHGGGFIMYLDDVPAGSVRWLPVDMDASIWEMRRMGVLPAFRGQGYSEHLLEAVILAAQTAGIEELRLGVRIDQPRLLDLYAAYEFELAPELDYAHANPAEPKPYVMRRFLR